MKNKKSLLYYFFVICIYILVFQNFLQQYISVFQYFDEILSLLIIPVVLLTIKKNKKIKRYDLIIVVCLIIFNVLGLYSSFSNNYQSTKLVFSDMLLCMKFFMTYYLSSKLFDISKLEKENIKVHFKIIIVILFGFTILNYIFKLYPAEYRYGIMSNKLFYSHPTYLAATCVFLLAGLIMTEEKLDKKFFILDILIICSTLRTKAIAFVAILILIYVVTLLSKKKISITKFVVLGIIVILISYNQINYYFSSNDETARSALLTTSFKIAKDYFPLGSGFATFGSYSSAVKYSPIYAMYGINNVYGLRKGATSFISDSFWPMILGQFGYAGLILYLICIIMIFLKIQKEYDKNNKKVYIGKIICLVYLLISSTSESAFVNSIAIPFALLINIKTPKIRNIDVNGEEK